MERLLTFFQGDLVADSGFTDDQIINSAMACESELRRAHLDLPPPPPDASEYPTRPFGLFVPPSVEQQIGRPILESPSELLRGRRTALRHNSRLSISIPPDGGPVVVESLDISTGPSTVGLPSVVSVDEDKNSPGHFSKPGNPHRETSATAHERRAAFAKTHVMNQVPNGITDTKSSISASPSSNGKAVGQTVTPARQKSTASQKGKDRERAQAADTAAPQSYGVSVRL